MKENKGTNFMCEIRFRYLVLIGMLAILAEIANVNGDWFDTLWWVLGSFALLIIMELDKKGKLCP